MIFPGFMKNSRKTMEFQATEFTDEIKINKKQPQ